MIRIGIVGTDITAQIHTGGLLTANNYEIIGCYAPDSRESMIFARQYRLVSYSSLEALFKYTDAVDIADDFPETLAIAEKSLKNLKHVYIAHPYQLNLDQIKHLTRLADESGVILQLGAGYRFCPVYYSVAGLQKQLRHVGIRHYIAGGENMQIQLFSGLARALDLVLGILQADVCRVEVNRIKPEGQTGLFDCRLECNNGCTVNIATHTLIEGDPELEITFDYADTIITADIFKSVIEEKYPDLDVTNSIALDAYSEKTIHRQCLRNFYNAAGGDPEAIRRIGEQLQSIVTVDYIIERIRQLRLVTISG